MARVAMLVECPIGGWLPECGCEWTWEYDAKAMAHIAQHGTNPEARLVITDLAAALAEKCDHGHIVTACEWAARVIAYEHARPLEEAE